MSRIASGRCPKCDSDNLEYSTSGLQDTQLYYPVECKDCGFVGREWHNLKFTGFTDNDGNDL